jgi:hypothetical protein
MGKSDMTISVDAKKQVSQPASMETCVDIQRGVGVTYSVSLMMSLCSCTLSKLYAN